MSSKSLVRDEAELRDYQSITVGWPTGHAKVIRSHRYCGRRGQPRGRHHLKVQHHRLRATFALAAILMVIGAINFEPTTSVTPPSSASAIVVDTNPKALQDDADPPVEPRKTPSVASRRDVRKPPVRVASGQAETVVQYALAQVGKPYRWGAAGPDSFDCSGLVMMAYAAIGIKLPHFTGTILNYGKQVSRSELRRGDIIWPQSNHVAIYLGDGKMVHASSSSGGVRVGSIYNYWTGRALL